MTAYFLTEALQARWQWHDIFKIIEGKKLQPRILYPAKLPLRFDRKIKALQTNNVRIQHHQASFTTNAKETSLGRNHKRRKRPTKNKPNKIKKRGSRISIITLNVGLNVPTKRHRLAGWISNK